MKRFVIISLLTIANGHADVVTLGEPKQPMPEGKTVIWSPLFQATWDKMNEHMGGKPTKVDPPNELMNRLDGFIWEPEKVMPKGSWNTWAGSSTQEFLDKVNTEAAKMIGEEKGPFELQNPDPLKITVFGLLDREVEFEKPFNRSLKVPLNFGEQKKSVRFFGTKGEDAGNYGEKVKVLSYRPVDGSHAIEISCKEMDDKVILYMPSKSQDFHTAIEWVREWRKTSLDELNHEGRWNDKYIHEDDDVRIPYVTYDTTFDFVDQLKSLRFYKNDGDPRLISRAEQKTLFNLFEKGVTVRSMTSIDLPFGSDEPRTYPRRFFYNKPFFVFLWRENAEWPYLATWVGDASVLKEFSN